MKLTERYALDELKQVYRVLHAALPENPELMDSALLEELQRELQERAAAEGVDVSLHAQWAAWLGGPLLRGL
jgi:hypothetical protein